SPRSSRWRTRTPAIAASRTHASGRCTTSASSSEDRDDRVDARSPRSHRRPAMTTSITTLPALVSSDEVRAPAPGWFHLLVAADHLVAPGDVIGELEILGRIVRITAPAVRGLVELPAGRALARRAVSYGDVLFRVATDVSIAGTTAAETA